MFALTPFNKSRGRDGSDLMDFYGMLDYFFNGDSGLGNFDSGFKIDVKDQEKNYLIEADLPGIVKSEVNLDYRDDKLIISVERQESVEEDKENYMHRERKFSSMRREIYLTDIDEEKIDAKLEDGILKIVVPKLETPKNKVKIEIK